MHEQILVQYAVIGNESKWLDDHQVMRACNDFSDSSTTRHCYVCCEEQEMVYSWGYHFCPQKADLDLCILHSLKEDAVGLDFPIPPSQLAVHFQKCSDSTSCLIEQVCAAGKQSFPGCCFPITAKATACFPMWFF